MPLIIEWGDESKTYTYIKFTRNWTWQDIHENREQYVAMLSSVQHRVDFVGDFSEATTPPTNSMENIRRYISNRLPNEGYFIIIGSSPIIQGMYDIIKTIVPKVADYVIFVSSINEAQPIIKQGRDETV